MKAFFPVRYIDVDASPPHAPGTQYRVAVGVERWEEQGAESGVYKVQMVYNGQVSGRSPSYPKGADDLDKVLDALQRLRKGQGESGRGKIELADMEQGMSDQAVAALGELHEQDTTRGKRLAELREAINEAFDDVRPSVPAEEVFDRLEVRYQADVKRKAPHGA